MSASQSDSQSPSVSLKVDSRFDT